MMKLLKIAILIAAMGTMVTAQTPGLDPRDVMTYSSPVIIGVVEKPWEKVIRPDKIQAVTPKIVQQPNGSTIVELPQMSRDYIVGYIYHVRIQEILKGDQRIRGNQVIQIFVPESFEDGVSLSEGQRFLLALANFEPTKDLFEKAVVSKVREPLSKPGTPFNLKADYYRVVADRNGAVVVTDKNSDLISDIRESLRLRGNLRHPGWSKNHQK